jgi:hypothetical protein
VRSLERFVPAAVGKARRNRARRFLFSLLARGGVGAEIGVWKGEFSKQLLAQLRPTELHLIDPWTHTDDPRYWFTWYAKASQAEMDGIYERVLAELGSQPGVVIHRERSNEVVAEFGDGYFDWVYIDGDHSYEGASGDLASWSPKVKAGGYVVCDDCKDDGVARALAEFVASSGISVTTRDAQAYFRVH